MKRLILQFLVLLFTLPLIAQTNVYLTGYVTEDSTGTPIPNQEVNIQTDSGTGGLIYYNNVYTDAYGFYVDTIPLEPGDTTGTLIITTIDCVGIPHTGTQAFNPASMNLTQDFQICYNTPSPCTADFTWTNYGTLSVQFTDLSTGTTGPWAWNFGDGTTSSAQNPLHTFSQGNYYNVTLTIGDSSTCWDMITQTVHVIDSTGGDCVASFIYYPDTTGGYTFYFYDQSQGNINSWYWDFGDGTYSQEQDPVHSFNAPGFYNVCLMVYGVDSLCWDTSCMVLNVGGGIGCQAQFTHYPDSAGSSTLIHFLDLSSGDITSWLWEYGDITFSTEQNPSYTFPENGTYYVCLTIEANNAGTICTSTWCEEVVVGNSSGCASYFTYQNNGLSVSFEGYMVNGQPATYSWDFGDGQTGQGQSIIHQYPVAGIYYATLTTVVQDPPIGSCTFSSAQSITVGDSTQWNQVYGQVFAGSFPLETGMVMIFSLDTNANFLPFIDISMVDSSGVYYFPMVPLGEYVIHAIPFLPAGYLPTYYGDVLNWEEATVVVLGDPNNPYNINLISAEAYASGIGTINGQINTLLKTTLIDKITMLLMNESGEAISFQQVDVDGQFVFPELDFGIYYLHAEMAGTQSDVIKIEITTEDPVIEVIMTFSGSQILGVRNANPELEAGVVYPNPVTDKATINIKLESVSQVTIELYNLTGQRVFHQVKRIGAGETAIIIPASQLRNGLYSLRIYTDSGLSLTRKLLISQ